MFNFFDFKLKTSTGREYPLKMLIPILCDVKV